LFNHLKTITVAEEKKFIVAKDSDFPEEVEVKIYNKGWGDIFGELGVEEERAKKIGNLIHENIHTSEGYAEAVAKVSKKLNNANELAVACIMIGRGIGLSEAEKDQKKDKK
jgi:hypothetical protein